MPPQLVHGGHRLSAHIALQVQLVGVLRQVLQQVLLVGETLAAEVARVAVLFGMEQHVVAFEVARGATGTGTYWTHMLEQKHTRSAQYGEIRLDGLGLCCLMTPGLIKDIQCHV